MNKQEFDILKIINQHPGIRQRDLADRSGYSLGMVNRCVNSLIDADYLTRDISLTDSARQLIADAKPKNAIILAAGFGMRMVPINMTVPKGLLEVKGEPLVERLIKQLHESGINDITVVIGYMKESFEYLIDEYGVKLVINPDYASKNNLHSLALAAERISDTYIVPSDVWCGHNPFGSAELYSWYMLDKKQDPDSYLGVNRRREMVYVNQSKPGNAAIGIAYITAEDSVDLKKQLMTMDADPANDGEFWEKALFLDDGFITHAVIAAEDTYEINTYEQLREIDSDSEHLKSDAIDVIRSVFSIQADEINNISVLKKGMTNRSFLFEVRGQKYIMRIPGEGTDKLINRANEARVYQAISGRGLCDDPVYINPENGYKITKFLNGIRTADAENEDDLKKCMKKLRGLHDMNIQVGHTFDLFGQIEFYEELWNGAPSVYKDYLKTKANVLSLRTFIDSLEKPWTLTHIDAVVDNFLFYNADGHEELQLTDWEYSGMQDPHVDIAMFCIYSYYDKAQTDRLIDIYFEGKCSSKVRAKIYCYIAACGLLWSNWSEYKHNLGIEFGEYGMRQYRYAKDFYRYALEEMKSGK